MCHDRLPHLYLLFSLVSSYFFFRSYRLQSVWDLLWRLPKLLVPFAVSVVSRWLRLRYGLLRRRIAMFRGLGGYVLILKDALLLIRQLLDHMRFKVIPTFSWRCCCCGAGVELESVVNVCGSELCGYLPRFQDLGKTQLPTIHRSANHSKSSPITISSSSSL
jgi:hypothetical protein